MNAIPKDILFLLSNNLDKRTFLILSHCSKSIYQHADSIVKRWYLEEGSYPYANHYGENDPAWMNWRISIVAKQIWIDNKRPKPIQYRKMTLIKGLPLSSVNLRSVNSRAALFFSKDGCRFQQTELDFAEPNLIIKNPLIREFFNEAVGAVIDVLDIDDQFILLSKVNDAISIVFIDFPNQKVNKVCALDVDDIACHHYYDGILTLGLKSGLLLKYILTKDNVSKVSSFQLDKPISTVVALPNGDVLVNLEETLFKVDGHSNICEIFPDLHGKLKVSKGALFLHSREGNLYQISTTPLKFNLLSTKIEELIFLGKDVYLFKEAKKMILVKDGKTLANVNTSFPIRTAAWQDGLLAVVFFNFHLMFFELKEGELNMIGEHVLIYKTVHALNFSKIFELIVTCDDGTIYSFLPFKPNLPLNPSPSCI